MKPVNLIALRISTCLCMFFVGQSTALAASDVIVVVSVKNPVVSLSKNQALDIFLGKAARFPDGAPAMAIDQVEGSESRNAFYISAAGKSPAQLKAYWSKIIFTGRGQPPREVANDDGVRKFLAANPGAIGYMDRSSMDVSVKAVLSP
jgi:ABC-type phosphate transport system substrate-binding protein